jgi:hypothetical protein
MSFVSQTAINVVLPINVVTTIKIFLLSSGYCDIRSVFLISTYIWAILRQNTDPSSPSIKSEKTLANLVYF